jgi:cytochrome c oxidase assembly protein subunit 15
MATASVTTSATTAISSAIKAGLPYHIWTKKAASTAATVGVGGTTTTTHVSHAVVGRWLLGTAGLVVGMIHVGGVTRLTQSGLSMTTWSPLGSLPPLSRAEWEKEFARYREFPEWQQRQSMTLQEFQFIYAWEYGHRMLGRTIGIAFTLPWLYFTVRGQVPKGYQPRLAALWTMGAAQGAVGWWMVKSGLGDDRRGDSREIRVQPVRLTTHLCMALATYGGLLWTALDVFSLSQTQNLQHLRHTMNTTQGVPLSVLARLRTGSVLWTGLTAVTIASGALVAGNDAGRAYNTWPFMEAQDEQGHALFVVPEAWPSPWENAIVRDTPTVQGNHRFMATCTAVSGVALMGMAYRLRPFWTPQVRNAVTAVGITLAGQYTLGVATLLSYVPISLAAAHQVGSLALFTSSLGLTHALRYAVRSKMIPLPR